MKTPRCQPIDRHRTDHITRHDPAQVLKAVAAQKALLLEYAVAKRFYDANPSTPAGELEGLHTAIKRLASTYNDHPDYNPAWAPE